MRRSLFITAGAVLALTACATRLEREKAFSPEWAYHSSREEESLNPDEEILLTGKHGQGPRTALRLDEEGKPALRMGGKSRVHTDLRISGGDPEIKVKYKWEW